MPLDQKEAEAVTRTLLARRDPEQARLQRIADYVAGKHTSVYVPAGAKSEYRWLLERATVNMLPLVINTVAQNLYVDGYRRAKTDDNAAPWETWQANRMDSRQHGIYRAALKYGIGYGMVLPGKPLPVIRPMSPRRMTAFYSDSINDEWPIYAVEVEHGQEKGSGGKLERVKHVRLLDDVCRYTFTQRKGRKGLEWGGREDHNLGVCPVVRYVNEVDLDESQAVAGEVEPLLEIQDQINSTTFNLLMAQQYAAHRQRWVTGMAPPLDENGTPIEPFRVRVDGLFVAEDPDTKFGEFSQTSLEGYLKSREESIRSMATISQTPPYYLLGVVSNLPLALDTVVPVPRGRSTMGELVVGDEVFAPDGSIAEVVGLSPVFTNHDCYRLRFDDGTEIVADAAHMWETTHFADPARPYGQGQGAQFVSSIVTTAEIAASLKTSMGTSNHFIPVAMPHDGAEREFLIDPYVLGVFLGDGDAHHGLITQHQDDAGELAAHLTACGETVRMRTPKDRPNCRLLTMVHDFTRCPYGHSRPRGTRKDTARCTSCRKLRDAGGPMPERVNMSFPARLRALNLFKNKHIPEEYFHGSAKQRLALLQGIMDTDGSVNGKQGSVAITLHDERLARDVHRLIQSLGHKVALRERTWRNAYGTGMCWRMSWSALDPVFRLSRKSSRQRTAFGGGDGKSNVPLRRYIVACDPVESVPVRCVTVSSDAHMFCVTDAFIATHNSAESLAAARDGLDRKTDERKSTFGESHEQLLRLAGKAAGDQKAWEDVSAQVVWRDTTTRALSQTVDALTKLVAGLQVPAQELWEKIPGVSQTDITRWKKTAEQADELARLEETLNRQTAPADRQLPSSPAGEVEDGDTAAIGRGATS
ncbi:phage portal protein [Acrocarpospora sp. B8E8]|uniref:phage portal protein n=1 Tax=Acrocarpospora sp. B8E8 TaxID=3153572 RepID=UPI00325D8BE5